MNEYLCGLRGLLLFDLMAGFVSYALVLQAATRAALPVNFAALTFLDGTGLIALFTVIIGALSHNTALKGATFFRGFTATSC